MTSRASIALDSAARASGIVAAAVVDSHGCVIEMASLVDGDLASAGVAAGQMLRQWTAVGGDLGRGDLQSLTIERTDGLVTVTPMGSDTALLVLGNHACRLGRARLATRRVKEAMLGRGSTVTDAEESAVPPLDHLDQLAQTMVEAPAEMPASPVAGEVIVIGAHTFRLVTKLIAHLLQIKGVRSSRLRAYSPSSTVIDVVLEDGATLATIDRRSLEDLAVEPTEEEGTRLVLRAGAAFLSSETPIRGAR